MIVGLVGNQNAGKTTLFNLLTGSNQKVGNWPGVTIERKEGLIKGSNDITLVDTPGVYSLSPYTDEEKVTRKFCLTAKPDLIINIIDATSLERSLYLTTQLLELNTDVIIACNMYMEPASRPTMASPRTKTLQFAWPYSLIRFPPRLRAKYNTAADAAPTR